VTITPSKHIEVLFDNGMFAAYRDPKDFRKDGFVRLDDEPIPTSGETVPTTLARRTDEPALRNLARDLCRHAQHAPECAERKRPLEMGPNFYKRCDCGLDLLLRDARMLGCYADPLPQAPPPTEAELAAHAAAGGFVGGLVGNIFNGLVHGAAARKEARCAKKDEGKSRARADRVPADPRRLGPGKGPRR
jgi:hypothetical protein